MKLSELNNIFPFASYYLFNNLFIPLGKNMLIELRSSLLMEASFCFMMANSA